MSIRIASAAGLAAILAAALAGAAAGTAGAVASGTGWSARADFRTGAAHANPGKDAAGRPVWLYLQGRRGSSAPSALAPLRGFSSAWAGPGQEFWSGTVTGWEGHPFPIVGVRGDSLARPGMLTVHPSPDASAVVAWRSPVAGAVTVTAKLIDVDAGGGDGIGWALMAEGKQLARGAVANGGRVTRTVRNVAVAPGTRIWLAVDSGAAGNDTYDTTALELAVAAA